jgi:2-polyprenyl-3-methyl-5-hydroxy-6-metoxy-1,4-benzoquinol methylase
MEASRAGAGDFSFNLGASSSQVSSPCLPYEPALRFVPAGDPQDEKEADCQGKRIGILIVAYNASATLLGVLKRIPPVVWKNVAEVVVLDDASRDATFELALGVKALHGLSKLTVLKHPSNLGYGGNQKAGYRYMIERGLDIAVLLHGDGQYAPEMLSQMYAPLVRGEADAVFGSRMMKGYGGPLKGRMPLYKFLGNRVLTTLQNRLLGMSLTEFHSGYRAYSLAALKQIVMDRMTGDFHFDTEIIIKLHHQGFRIKEIPIPTYYGTELCHVDGMKYARNVLGAVWRYRRCVSAVREYPEFAEYWRNYSIKDAPNSSHSIVRRLVANGMDVLDIGCGDGQFATRLAGGCRVTGVDQLPNPARQEVFEDYIPCDLSQGLDPALPRLENRRFDRILLLDVLEHLTTAPAILRECVPLLKPSGQVIVSLPNVANITIRAALLFGQWNYADRGILDRTHVQFYTRKTGRALLEQNGYQVTAAMTTVMPVELVLGLRPDSVLMKGISGLLWAVTALMPGLFGYQMILVARPKAQP